MKTFAGNEQYPDSLAASALLSAFAAFEEGSKH
jgi:hypothetical protein